MDWKSAKVPPKSNPDNWSNDIVVITNFGRVFLAAYYNGSDGGCWQRPGQFKDGEKIEQWIEQP